ncbi:MAG: hypothetical protein LBF49_00025 [Puniceicoccales bacterium]|jgi:hypothetical protein|nr:hypothetical protein [Puniceicoccales bacterium]
MNIGNIVRNDGMAQPGPLRGHRGIRQIVAGTMRKVKQKVKETALELKGEVKDLAREVRENTWGALQKLILLVAMVDALSLTLRIALSIALRFAPGITTSIVAVITMPAVQVVAWVAIVVAIIAVTRRIWKAIPAADREAVIIMLILLKLIMIMIKPPSILPV